MCMHYLTEFNYLSEGLMAWTALKEVDDAEFNMYMDMGQAFKSDMLAEFIVQQDMH